ncbi:hypothetical protein [Oricola cellulosilytica]|uniref:GlsB/YeaQ/YmgE family stress response membrane protein n=1 Tax=Oricola cellulosilytica TaxID=1429082 RepID=A0A4R0P927_9HYPH|nr:hypothetical protein [Oricola cellulosilytica]TCD13690.1 hypothetical protein E0D97_11285 [Oricola cellulosilytica]
MDTTTLLMIGLIVCAGAYFIASAMDGVMGADGFGTVPNMVILLVGGFLGLYLMNWIHIPLGDPTMQAVAGITGAFVSLAFLATIKAIASRLGY